MRWYQRPEEMWNRVRCINQQLEVVPVLHMGRSHVILPKERIVTLATTFSASRSWWSLLATCLQPADTSQPYCIRLYSWLSGWPKHSRAHWWRCEKFILFCFCFAVFEEPEDPSNRSFFSEIISSISDVKFSHSGRYIMTRDYLTVKVWDLNMENRPIETYQVHNATHPRYSLCVLLGTLLPAQVCNVAE